MFKDAYTATDIASLLGITQQGIWKRAKREGRQSRPRSGRGGGNEWLVASMPQATRAAIVAGLARSAEPSQPPAVINTPVPALVPSTSAGQVTKKQLDTAEARLVFLREVERLSAVGGKETAIMQLVAASRDNKLAPHLQRLIPAANDKFGGGGKRGLSRRRLYAWVALFEKEGVPGLIPKKSGRVMSIPAWFPFFLSFYQKPQKPSIALAHGDFCREYATRHTGTPPSYYAVRRMLNKMAMPDAEAGRATGNALLKLRPHRLRKTDKLMPGDVYTADGTTFDAEIAHPQHGQPFKPEVTGVIDVATRKCVGMSLALSENAFAVLDAIRMACLFGGIPALFYTDNGPGYHNDVLEAPVVGMFARLGISPTNAIPGRPQGKGLMERAVKTLCENASKRLPTCTHADMDVDAARKVHKITRAEIKKYGKSSLLPTFDAFKTTILARVDEYNATPHRALPKITDAVTGKPRHMSPNEAWDAFVTLGWQPVTVPEDMRDELFMPGAVRMVRNGMVEFHKGKYYARELEQFHGDKVEIRYDVWDSRYVLVFTLDGVKICKAVLDGNAVDYFPESMIEAAKAKREAAQIKRIEAKAQRIVPGAQMLLPEPEETFTVADMFTTGDQREPEAVFVELAARNEPEPMPKTAPKRPVFTSSQKKYVWLMQNQSEQTPDDMRWLREYTSGAAYASCAEFYAFRGIAYPDAPAPATM